MVFKETPFKLKDGRDALLRSPCEKDADEIIEGNSRARSLYEKMGFRITGVKPDAIRMKDGTFVNEYMMVKRL